MGYSYKEMERLCLDLADESGPREADALRDLARNYEAVIGSDDTGPDDTATNHAWPELSFRQILMIAAAIYAFWTPLYLWLQARYVPDEQPTGRNVEQISGFTKTEDGRYSTRTYRFVTNSEPLAVYENTMPLPPSNYEFQKLNPQNVWRFVTIKTSDGSDPATNGRRYYVVPPSATAR